MQLPFPEADDQIASIIWKYSVLKIQDSKANDFISPAQHQYGNFMPFVSWFRIGKSEQ